MFAHNGTGIDETLLLGTVFGVGYTIMLGTLALCGTMLSHRLHDLTTEHSLERLRQNEMMERFMIFVQDTLEEPDTSEESDQPQDAMLVTPSS